MNEKPPRVQLSRRKGWRMPPDTANVARPGPWGNPFRSGDTGPDGRPIATREEAVALYRGLVTGPPAGQTTSSSAGMHLACWCPLDGPCHADVLLERANDRPFLREVAAEPGIPAHTGDTRCPCSTVQAPSVFIA